MTFELAPAQHADPDLPRRRTRLEQLGLLQPHTGLDEFAAKLAREAGAEYAMVNFITSEQFFAGLYTAPDAHPVERTMDRAHGYCPHVLRRKKALPLPDVFASAHYKANEVVDRIGIRSYAGAPLLEEESGLPLGTVCFVGTTERPDKEGHEMLALIKARRDELMQVLQHRTF